MDPGIGMVAFPIKDANHMHSYDKIIDGTGHTNHVTNIHTAVMVDRRLPIRNVCEG